jgi:DNA-binding MltR family transcriptional regulator
MRCAPLNQLFHVSLHQMIELGDWSYNISIARMETARNSFFFKKLIDICNTIKIKKYFRNGKLEFKATLV